MKFKVIFYEMTNGEAPVENFMQSLDIKMKAKLTGLIEILSEYGPQLREPYSKSLIYRNDYIERCEKDENI